MDRIDQSLVPRHRFGRLLRDGRVARGLDLDDMADRCDGRFGRERLAAIERGVVALADGDIDRLCVLYGVEYGELTPSRTQLIIDFDEGRMIVGSERTRFDVSDTDTMLQRYAAIVHRLRDVEIGTPLQFRREDLFTLSVALELDQDEVESRLATFLESPDSLRRRQWHLNGRIVVPAAGVFVALASAGALLLTPATSADASESDAVVAVVEVTTEIGDAVVLERGTDGQPGVQRVR